MLDKTLVTNLFNYIKEHPTILEIDIINITMKLGGYTKEEATQWFNSFYIGLHKALILDEPTYDCMVNKIITMDDKLIDVIIEIMDKYLDENPLQYQKDREIKRINDEINIINLEPDEILIPNDYKFQQINELEMELEKWL